MAKKGDFVMVYDVVLTPDQRAPQAPEDTRACPLEMRVRGFLRADGAIGDVVTIETLTGRLVTGKLVEVAPTYSHSFGKHVPEIFAIGKQLKGMLFGGDQ